MLTLEQIIEKMQALPRGQLSELSMNTRIGYQRLWRIRSGKVKVSYHVYKILADYFES